MRKPCVDPLILGHGYLFLYLDVAYRPPLYSRICHFYFRHS